MMRALAYPIFLCFFIMQHACAQEPTKQKAKNFDWHEEYPNSLPGTKK